MRIALSAVVVLSLVIALPVVHAVELRLTYDANGNLVAGDGNYRTYNAFNQLSAIYNGSNSSGVLLETYRYHPVEERVLVKKSYYVNGSVKETSIYFSRTFERVINASGEYNVTNIYHDGALIARNTNGIKTFMHTDAEGTIVATTNSSGNVTSRTEYSPFGEQRNSSQSRYGYEGKEADTLAGDTDFNFRKYKPEWGLFTQPDSTIQNAYDPQALNRFLFERAAPAKMIDPDGRNFRIYLDEDSRANIGSFDINFGHIAVGVDDPEHPGSEIFFENTGLGADQFPDAKVRYLASVPGLFSAKTSATPRAVNFGNARIAPLGYEQYLEYEQDENQDRAMIQFGQNLVSKPWHYAVGTHDSQTFAVLIIESGGYRVQTSTKPMNTFKTFATGKGITAIQGKIELIGGKLYFVGIKTASPVGGSSLAGKGTGGTNKKT